MRKRKEEGVRRKVNDDKLLKEEGVGRECGECGE